MRSRCDKLRELALKDGIDSSRGSAWRLHCRSCESCRTELYILETLQRQAVRERTHLGRREVAVLLEQVRHHQADKDRAPPLRTWAFRFACLWAAAACVAFLSSHTDFFSPQAGNRAGAAASQARSGISLAVNANPAFGQPAGEEKSLASPESSLDSRLRQLRRRVMRRRESLQQLIEDEFHLHDTTREDVWDLPSWPAVALA